MDLCSQVENKTGEVHALKIQPEARFPLETAQPARVRRPFLAVSPMRRRPIGVKAVGRENRQLVQRGSVAVPITASNGVSAFLCVCGGLSLSQARTSPKNTPPRTGRSFKAQGWFAKWRALKLRFFPCGRLPKSVFLLFKDNPAGACLEKHPNLAILKSESLVEGHLFETSLVLTHPHAGYVQTYSRAECLASLAYSTGWAEILSGGPNLIADEGAIVCTPYYCPAS